MPLSRRRALAAFALAPTIGLSRIAAAQNEAWPNKPLKIVVPSSAGSSIDAVARIYAEHLRNALKQSVVVENRPGANQTIGIAAIQSAPADGYAVLMTSTELVRVPLLYPKLRYDPFREFMPLTQVAAPATYLCVPGALQVSNLKEFIERARQSQPPLSIGSHGQGSGAHFYSELLAQATGITLNHVAYRGEVPLMPDLLSGRLSSGWLSGNLVNQYVGQGKLKVLGVASMKHRVASMPAVPTFSELGIPGLDVEGFIGMFVRAGTPVAIVERLAAELNRIRARQDVRTQVEGYGFEAGGAADREKFSLVMRASYDGWGRAISQAKIKLDE
nr:tripartite tricarboxylate transporter substrate binding protein [uncultured Cupriavidus sp.]